MKDKIKKMAKKIANPGDLVKANIYSSPIKNIGKVMQIEIAKKIAGKKDGGLINAIEKVKAKEMKLGGDVPMPKPRPESLKADKTKSLNKNFSKNVAKTNEKNKKLIGNQKKLDKNKDGVISGADFKMMEYGGKVQKMKYGGVAKGGKMGCRGMGAAIKGGGFSIR